MSVEMEVELDLDITEFKSPVRKLVQFFKKSRDKWKDKCQEAKRKNKGLNTQARAVEKSRDQWKQRALDQARKIAELEQELEKKTPPLN